VPKKPVKFEADLAEWIIAAQHEHHWHAIGERARRAIPIFCRV
jgi:hypothetical protein